MAWSLVYFGIMASSFLALAAVAATLGWKDRLIRAFSLLLLARGMVDLGLAMNVQPATLWANLFPYAQFAVPFAAANFALLFAHAHTPLARRRPALVNGLQLLLGAGYLACVVGLAVGGRSLADASQYGALWARQASLVALGAGLAWWLARAPSERRHGSCFPMIVAAASEPVFAAVSFVARTIGVEDLTAADRMLQAGAVLVALVGALALIRLMRGVGPRAGAFAGSALVLAVVSGLAVSTWRHVHVVFGLRAAWALFFVAAASYALFRYRLFGLDLRLRLAVNYGSLAFMSGGIWFIVTEAVQEAVAPDGPIWIGILAAGGVALLLRPLQLLSKGLADRMFPRVERSPAYMQRRRTEIFMAAMTSAYLDGVVDDVEREQLRRLARQMELPEQEVEAVEARFVSPIARGSAPA